MRARTSDTLVLEGQEWCWWHVLVKERKGGFQSAHSVDAAVVGQQTQPEGNPPRSRTLGHVYLFLLNSSQTDQTLTNIWFLSDSLSMIFISKRILFTCFLQHGVQAPVWTPAQAGLPSVMRRTLPMARAP